MARGMRAFLQRWWHGRDPILGIDVRDDSIVVSDINLSGSNRWLKISHGSREPGSRGPLVDPDLFISNIREFIAAGPLPIERCAVALPESLTYMASVTLPKNIPQKAEDVRYEAALEGAYLRRHDVRGAIYPLCEDGSRVLVVAVKIAEVEALESALRLIGLEVSCLTPRVFALHHLVALSGVEVTADLVAFCDNTATIPQFHLFQCPFYLASARGWPDFLKALERIAYSERSENKRGGISLILHGQHPTEIGPQHRDLFYQVVNLTTVPLPRGLTLAQDQVVSAALSLWETRHV